MQQKVSLLSSLVPSSAAASRVCALLRANTRSVRCATQRAKEAGATESRVVSTRNQQTTKDGAGDPEPPTRGNAAMGIPGLWDVRHSESCLPSWLCVLTVVSSAYPTYL